MAKPDGGPAFPQSLAVDAMGGLNVSYNTVDGAGMTLRDYFAAKAMAAYLVSPNTSQRATDYANDCAEWAYIQADAMLAERTK